jgi:hypothetical protein
MPFGKHKGQELRDVPQDYLCWILANIQDLNSVLRDEITRVLDLTPARPDPAPAPPVSRFRDVVKCWYRHASLRHHPDHGGSNERQRVVNEAYEDLMKAIGTLDRAP